MAATAGAAVGMGNLWKFSALAGSNGGAAFVAVYLACVLLMSLPVLIAEVVIGSRGRANPVAATVSLAREAHVSSGWQVIGWLGCITGLLILSYYSIFGGIGLFYIGDVFAGSYESLTALDVGQRFNAVLEQELVLIQWHSIFLAIVVLVVSLGVELGLARLSRFILPVLLLMLVALVAFSLHQGDADQALHFLFAFDVASISPEIVVAAMGQAFFTLSIGLGAMMAFGAYLPDGRSVMGMLSIVVLIDTVVAILAGLAIFPLVFSAHIEPGMGPGLMFVALPYAFSHIEYGEYFGSFFFIMVSLVALGSGVALLEPAVAWLVERFRWYRFYAAALIGFLVWLLGVLALFSFNRWSEVRYWDMTIFGLLDFTTANLLLPFSGLLIAFFVGWQLRMEVVRDEFYRQTGWLFQLWYGLLRFVAIPAIIIIMWVPLYRQWL